MNVKFGNASLKVNEPKMAVSDHKNMMYKFGMALQQVILRKCAKQEDHKDRFPIWGLEDATPLSAYSKPRMIQPKYADEESSDNFYSFGESEDEAPDSGREKDNFYKSLCLM